MSDVVCLLRDGSRVTGYFLHAPLMTPLYARSPSPRPVAVADVTNRPQTDPAPPHQLARDTLPSSGVAAGMGRECSDMSSLKVTQ